MNTDPNRSPGNIPALPNSLVGFWKRLTEPHSSIKEIGAQRQAQLLAVLSIVFGILSIAGTLSIIQVRGIRNPASFGLIGVDLACIVAYFLSRTIYPVIGSSLLTASLTAAAFLSVAGGSENPSGALYIYVPLTFLLGSVLLPLRGLAVLVVVNVILTSLTGVIAPQVPMVTVVTLVGSLGTIGVLFLATTVFRNLVERQRLRELQATNFELQSLRTSLEQRVGERTRDLELSAEIGRNLSQIRDLDTLLKVSVEAIQEHFDLYYTQVYLADPTGRTLALRAGTGPVGTELLQRSHHLPIGPGSINGTTASTQQATIVPDTALSEIYRPNPLLPETRSEMAVPLMVGDRVVGVIDLQSRIKNSLTGDNLPAFEALAGQLAVAVHNATLFAQAEQARKDLETHASQQMQVSWSEYLNAVDRDERFGYRFDKEKLTFIKDSLPPTQDGRLLTLPLQIAGALIGTLQMERNEGETWTAEEEDVVKTIIDQATRQLENLRLLAQSEQYRAEAEKASRFLTREGWAEYLELTGAETGYVYDQNQVVPIIENRSLAEETTGLTQALRVGKETIGELTFDGVENADEETSLVIETIADVLGSHIESLRLSTQTYKALTETEALYAGSEQVVRATSVNEVLRAVIETTALRRFEHGSVMLFSETWGNQIPETGMLIGSWERHGESVVPLGTRYPLRQMPYSSLIQRDRPTLIKDINADERIDPQTRSALAPLGKSVAIFPMVSREQWIGWLSVVANDPETLEQEEIRQISSLVDQATTVIQTIQLFQQTQSALVATQESEKLVRTIIDSTPDWIYIRDRDHRYRLVNTEYANAMHIQPELFLNKTDLELGLSEEMVKENIEKGLSGFWADDQKVMETGEPVVYPSEPIMINGSLRVFNTFRTPLKDNEGKAWGVLTFSRDVTEHELAQAALARRARELNLVANIGTQVSAILEPGLMLQTVADRIQESFRLYHAHIYLVNENKDTLTLTGGAGEVGRKLVAQGWQIPLGQEQSLVARAARTRQGVIVNDVSIDPNFLPNELLPNTRAEMAIPLIVGDQVLGVLDVQADQINRFSEEDVNIQTTLAVQVAVALQNARTYDQTQREAEYEALVNTISQRIQNTTTVEGALQVAIRELGRALGASKTYVQLGLSRQQPKV